MQALWRLPIWSSDAEHGLLRTFSSFDISFAVHWQSIKDNQRSRQLFFSAKIKYMFSGDGKTQEYKFSVGVWKCLPSYFTQCCTLMEQTSGLFMVSQTPTAYRTWTHPAFIKWVLNPQLIHCWLLNCWLTSKSVKFCQIKAVNHSLKFKKMASLKNQHRVQSVSQ